MNQFQFLFAVVSPSILLETMLVCTLVVPKHRNSLMTQYDTNMLLLLLLLLLVSAIVVGGDGGDGGVAVAVCCCCLLSNCLF